MNYIWEDELEEEACIYSLHPAEKHLNFKVAIVSSLFEEHRSEKTIHGVSL